MDDQLTPRQREWTKRFDAGLPGVRFFSCGINARCNTCNPFGEFTDRDVSEGRVNEPESFSWSSCDVCGNPLGGDRHPAHGFIGGKKDSDLCHFDICQECLFYWANGDIPDDEYLDWVKVDD